MLKLFSFILSVLVSATMAVTLVAPVQAARIYDHESGEFIDVPGPSGVNMANPVKKEIVTYETNYAAGTIVVETGERRLYLVLGDGKALRYGIGVGREGFTWSGSHRITRKAEWPRWTPPPAMRKRIPDLPPFMEGGPDNPLGARALYIGSTLYRIHGTSEPWTIGQAVSSGCIRLTNEDVTDLYERVQVGALVVVRH